MSIIRYGREFAPINGREWSLLEIELIAFREGFTIESGGLGKARHMQNLIRELAPNFVWEDDFGPIEVPQEQIEALCEYNVVGFTAGASMIKSAILAWWAILNWFADPLNTLVIVVSTSAQDARQRIWGAIVNNWRQCRKAGKSMGKLVESMSIIKLSDKTDGDAASDNSSICLVAAGAEFQEDALKKLQGRKNKRVFLVLDELQDCSPLVVKEAIWNLNANDYFHVSAAGNASDRNDPHGQFLMPVGGWTTISTKTHRWKIKVGTQEGVAIHFDGEDSPNMKRFLAGRSQLPFMRKAEEYLAAKQHLGEESPQFLRQFRGFWSSRLDQSNYIVTDATLAARRAYDTLGQGFAWQSSPVSVMGIDPSYSNDGDRFIVMIIDWGLCTDGVWRLYFKESIHLLPRPHPGESRDHAAVRECRQLAIDRNISPLNVGMDASAGTPLLSIAHKDWSPDILAVPFGGSPTDLQVSAFDKRQAKDVYANRTSELHYIFVEFLNFDQVRGVRPEHAKELCARQFELVVHGKVKIESKIAMKKRLGFSPDIDDGGAVGLAVIRERLKVLAGAGAAPSETMPEEQQDWRALQRRCDVKSRTMQRRRPAGIH